MTTTLIISGCIAFFLAGYLCALTRNKARMTKLASSNIDLIEMVSDITNKNNILEDLNSELMRDIKRYSEVVLRANKALIENEALKFQIQQYNVGMDEYKFKRSFDFPSCSLESNNDQMKFTDQG